MPMTREERKAALVLRRVRQAAIAAETGHSETHVSDVIAGKRRNESIEKAIAAAIKRPVREVFPPMPAQRLGRPARKARTA